MDLGFRFQCQAETRRSVSFLGISVTLTLVVQYSELLNSKLGSSLTVTITSFTMGTSSVNPIVEGNKITIKEKD